MKGTIIMINLSNKCFFENFFDGRMNYYFFVELEKLFRLKILLEARDGILIALFFSSLVKLKLQSEASQLNVWKVKLKLLFLLFHDSD